MQSTVKLAQQHRDIIKRATRGIPTHSRRALAAVLWPHRRLLRRLHKRLRRRARNAMKALDTAL